MTLIFHTEEKPHVYGYSYQRETLCVNVLRLFYFTLVVSYQRDLLC